MLFWCRYEDIDIYEAHDDCERFPFYSLTNTRITHKQTKEYLWFGFV